MVNKDNFVLLAMGAYINTRCKTLIEFEEDLAKFSNLNRLCSKDISPIEIHLIMNLIISLFNIFEQETCIKLMFFKIKKADWPKLKTILTFLNRMPKEITDINLIDSDILSCKRITETLNLI